MTRVGRALAMHELLERARDRWVLVTSALFALLASGVSLYARGAEAEAARLAGPSLVTLASLFVPLVALVLSQDAIAGERERNTLGLLLSLPVSRFEVAAAKFLGRAVALGLAVSLGLGAAIVLAHDGQAQVLSRLLLPTLLLGLAFLSLGLLISTLARRQVTAASGVLVVWFLLVFFYDLGLLALLVTTDGAVGQDTVVALVAGNPSGLYRIQMMRLFAGPSVLQELGMTASLPGNLATSSIWTAWIVVPLVISGMLLSRRKAL